jgi:hypothetical protein
MESMTGGAIHQDAKIIGIQNKRIRKTGERQYEVTLETGEKKWIGEEDVPLCLIPNFEAKWQHRQKRKKKKMKKKKKKLKKQKGEPKLLSIQC